MGSARSLSARELAEAEKTMRLHRHITIIPRPVLAAPAKHGAAWQLSGHRTLDDG
jgi:hypothetical protein